MAFDFKQKLPTPQEIREMYPVPDHVAQIKKRETKKSVKFSPANPTALSPSSDPVPQIMKRLSATMCAVWFRYRRRLRTRS